MPLGHGPEKLVELLEDNWAVSRSGRGDVPPIIKDQTQGENPAINSGVLPTKDRERPAIDYGKHDIIHAYHPEGNPPTSTDRGFKEERLVEAVQIDIDIVDRNVSTTERSGARARMIGDLDDLAALNDPPYPGIAGEVKYILEGVRRGYDIWDTVSSTFVNYNLGNSNARVSFDVELEQIARNTRQ